MAESRKDVLPECGAWLPQAVRLFRQFEPADVDAGKPVAEQLEDSSSWRPGVSVGVALAAIMRELRRTSIEGRADGKFETLCARCWGDGLAVPHDTDDVEAEPSRCPNPVTSEIADTGDYAMDCGCRRVPCPACDKGKLTLAQGELAGARAELAATRHAFDFAVSRLREVEQTLLARGTTSHQFAYQRVVDGAPPFQHVHLWNEINRFALTSPLSVERQRAVAAVEHALSVLVAIEVVEFGQGIADPAPEFDVDTRFDAPTDEQGTIDLRFEPPQTPREQDETVTTDELQP